MAGHITVSEKSNEAARQSNKYAQQPNRSAKQSNRSADQIALLEALELDADVLEALLDDEIPLYEDDAVIQDGSKLSDLACLREARAADRHTGVQFRECMIDYTACPNRHCVKKLI